MIPFSPPRIDEKIIEAVEEVLLSGWITTGPRTSAFENALTAYCGHRKTVCVSSATAGMELLLRWFGLGPGDEVILPAYTYCATANVVVHCGAKPVLVDVGDDFNISVSAVEQAITPRTKVIIPVDIGGWPCDYNALHALIRKPSVRALFQPLGENQKKLGRILLLSDAAHSLGAVYDGKKSGALSDCSVFSFHAVKNLTTAEGGAICLNLPDTFDADEVYGFLKTAALHGQTKDALQKMQKGHWKYDVLMPGYKCNMTDIQAAMGLVEISRYKETLEKKKYLCENYNNMLSGDNRFVLPVFEQAGKVSSFHLYMLRISSIDEAKRDEIIREINRQDVSVNVHFQPLPILSYYKNAGFDIRDFPNAWKLYSGEISLPVFYDLQDEDARRVTEVLLSSVDKICSA